MANPFNISKEGSVASRFVSSSDLSEAQKKREADIKAAYDRIGQEPPPQAKADDDYDPRTLYERLQDQKNRKQEKFDEQWKLSNQFRGIDEGESQFLAEVERDRREEERQRLEEERKELEAFRQRAVDASPPPLPSLGSPGQGSSTETPKATTGPSSSSVAASGSSAKSKRKRDGGILGIKKKTKKPTTTTTTTTTAEGSKVSASMGQKASTAAQEVKASDSNNEA